MSYITLTGCDYYLGTQGLRLEQSLLLKKDYDNDYDEEAIAVYLESGIKVGYVANSVCSVAKGTKSAGRIYDTFDECCKANICFILEECVIAKLA